MKRGKLCLLEFLFFLAIPGISAAQCSVSSTNGWTAAFSVTPVSVIPSTTNCQWSYNYDIGFNISVAFSGSTTSRSVSGNIYFTCTGGTGGTPYESLGTFTANTTLTSQVTSNAARTYTAVSAYNYGSNPNCTSVTLSNVNCGEYEISYWGSGVTNGSFTCSTSTTLPVGFLSFDANYSEGRMNFKWATASEINNNYFTLERSTDMINYESIETVKGHGTTTATEYYTGEDDNPIPGIVYYRLKQTDFNNAFSYSSVFIDDNLIRKKLFDIRPNQSHDVISIDISQLNAEAFDLKIVNNAGETVLYRSLPAQESNVRFDVSNLPIGLYIIVMTGLDGYMQEERFLKY